MSSQRRMGLAKRFVVTFALVAAVVGVASLISGRRHDSSKSNASPATTTPLDPTISAGGSARGSPLSTPSSAAVVTGLPTTAAITSDVATSGSSVDSTSGTEADSTTAAPTISATPSGSPLARPDVAGYCVHALGDGAAATVVDSTFTFSCVPTQSVGQVAPVTAKVSDVCVAQFGGGSRRVSLLTAPTELRCTPQTTEELGSPDFDRYCKQIYGASSRATTVAVDALGWRCATLPNGVYQEVPIAFDKFEVDSVCQITTGAESYAGLTGDADRLEDWRCYGAP